MKKFGLRVFWIFVIMYTGVSQVYAQVVPLPFRIGGTVTIDGVQITQATDDGLIIKVTKQNGTDYTDASGNPPGDNDGLNNSDWYLVDVPMFDADGQTGGANPGETAVIHVFVNDVEFDVTSPVNGEFQVGNSGLVLQVDIQTPFAPDIKANGSGSPITLGTSETLSISVGVAAQSSLGTPSDWWIVVNTPSGEWEHFDLTQFDFIPGLIPTLEGFSLVALSSTVIFSTSGLGVGTYTYYFAVDLGGGQLFLDSVGVIVTDEPLPRIFANNSGETVNINEGDPLAIAVSLSSGNSLGAIANWFIAVNTPSGWQHFDLTQLDFIPSLSPTLPGVNLFDFGSTVIFSTSDLGAGTYTYYFAVDLGGGQLFFKSVAVNIL